MSVLSMRRSSTRELAPKSQAIVEWMSRASAYDEQPARVECVETHISWIFLTDRYAYKLKKPVRFDFLDFSTKELRRQACETEVRLNRRLARHVYLSVVPVTLRRGRLALGGEGTPVDWVVKMRRLPADRSLDRLIRAGTLTPEDVRRVGQTLTDFFSHLPPLTIRTDGYRRRLIDHVRTNRAELLNSRHGLDGAAVRRVHEAQLRFLLLAPELFDNRVLDGRVVDGHGDLRPEHVYLTPRPTIIDCVEFNAEFRQLDVLDELCFLAMECARLDAAWVGDEVMAHYCEQAGDHPRPELGAFYKCYRACVRAKVLTLRAEQLAGQDRTEAIEAARGYLSLADDYGDGLGSPVLLVVRGLTGTGKSTLARRLADLFEMELLGTDAIRRELFGASESPAAYDADIYRPEHRARVYEEMIRRANALLDERLSVVLDGTFLTAASRTDVARLAADAGAALLVVDCHCPDAVARSRIASRLEAGGALSESRPDIHARQKESEEPDPPGLPVFHVETAGSFPTIVDAVLTQLGALWTAAR